MTLGLVCDACSAFNALGATTCSSCGDSLGVAPNAGAGPAAGPRADATLSEASELRCPSCSSVVPEGHRFCGACGKPIAEAAPARPQEQGRQKPKTMFFSVMQAPGRAKLILIKGDG